ncbi:MAG TPA: response regulator [Pseudomonadota bacterium]|nr:response regulator [Pseudomonadota bacterium]
MTQRKSTILLVDDAATIRLLMRGLLGPDYTYLEADNGAAGFALAKKHLPDFILMDVQMPVADGVEGLRWLKAEGTTKEIPVVMLTTDTTPQRRAQCRALGCAEFMSKPVDREALTSIVQRYLQRGRS